MAKLQSDRRWFVGPHFLYNEGCPSESESTKHDINAENKTILNNTGHISESISIIKQSNILRHGSIVSDVNNSLINWIHYSSLDRLARHLACILKLKQN